MSRTLALFDLDGTLLPGDSDHAFGAFMVTLGWADADLWQRRNDEFYAQYQAGRLDLAEYIDFATSVWRDRSPEEAAAAHARYMREVIEPMMHDSARQLVRQHLQAGHLCAMVTATNEFVTRPIAAAFELPHILAVNLKRDDQGRVTGAIEGVPTYQAGKIDRVEAWLAEQGLSLDSFDDVVFYSDSTNDLPLLERVRTPIATNPTPALAAIARERGWRILNLFHT
ncbi:histidinol-phosphatase [Ideonella paludis]|uniref:HAD family hydrolase n=1 Tax=Ideonella paludis TaxID=1233411 RepID=A0ABS5E0L0_9BURK|nr:HAD family hydrolase [Ideonella paludis]MBQ0936928.1 HAD family hydrolase [Ideonella paludis]